MLTYPELEIGLHRWDAEAWTVDLRFNDPDSDGFDSSATTTELVDFQQLRELYADDQAYGMVLGQALLADPAIRERFARARAVAQSRRFRCGSACSLVRVLPSCISCGGRPSGSLRSSDRLLTDEHLLFSRFLTSDEGVSVPFRPRAELRALVVIANPSDLAQYGLAPLDIDAELQRARAGLGDIDLHRAARTGPADTGRYHRPTAGGLRHPLPGLPRCDARREDAAVARGRDRPAPSDCPDSELADRLRELSRRPRLVVLASCQSAGDGAEEHGQDDGALATLGPRLARAGIPAVVAMQGNVSKRTVDAFMPRFFEELQRDGQIDRAMTVARAAVCDLNRPDWWMPVLFLALKSGRIWYEPGFEEHGGGAGAGDGEMARAVAVDPGGALHSDPRPWPGRVARWQPTGDRDAMGERLPLPHGPVRPSEPSPGSPVSGGAPGSGVPTRTSSKSTCASTCSSSYGDNLPEEVRRSRWRRCC